MQLSTNEINISPVPYFSPVPEEVLNYNEIPMRFLLMSHNNRMKTMKLHRVLFQCRHDIKA